MDRIETAKIVEPYIYKIKNYLAVDRVMAQKLLSAEKYEKLLNDKIRNQGPTQETLYPWNIIDYLHSL